MGSAAEALACGGSTGVWTNFPYGGGPPPGQSCVTGVIGFYARQFGKPLNGSAGPCGEPYGPNGACNYWVTLGSQPSYRYPDVWERHPWGTATPQTYDMVVFTSDTASESTAYGHVASVDHVDAEGRLFVTDSNWSGCGHETCDHLVTWKPYGFYRLKELAVPAAGGSLAAASCQSLSGLAEDPSSPSTAISVEVYMDGAKGTGTLVSTLQTASDHSFSMPTPVAVYDGREHTVYLYALHVSSGASDGLLANAPATLHCAAPLMGDFYGTGRDDIAEFRDDWTTLPACGRWGSSWSCDNTAATYVAGVAAGNGGSGVLAGSTALVGDMNGDGRSDVIEWNPASSSIPVCFSADHGWACEDLPATYVGGEGAGNAGSGVYPGATAFMADVNGDGKADLVEFDPTSSTIPVCFATEHGWACENRAATYTGGNGAGNSGSGIYAPAPGTVTTALVDDVNGDGKADLVQWNPLSSTIPECLTTTHGWACANSSATYVSGAGAGTSGSGVYPATWARLADVNGDGRADLVQFDPTSTTIPVCFSTDRGWACENLRATYTGGAGAGNSGSGVYRASTIVTADLNGDGRADVLQYVAGSTSLPVCFSTPKGWSCENLAISTAGASTPLPFGLPVIGRIQGDKGLGLVQVTPDSGSGVLRTCTLEGRGWSCASESASLP